MNLDFSYIMEIISQGVPPEITHFQNLNHPGSHWWLKTVIASDTHQEINKIWNQLAQANPRIIWIGSVAYDWQQKIIPQAQSIWIHRDFDVVVDYNKGQLVCEIVNFDQHFNAKAQDIIQDLQQWHDKNPDKISQNDWLTLKNITHLMCEYTTDNQAVCRRNQWQIISNDENTGQTNNS